MLEDVTLMLEDVTLMLEDVTLMLEDVTLMLEDVTLMLEDVKNQQYCLLGRCKYAAKRNKYVACFSLYRLCQKAQAGGLAGPLGTMRQGRHQIFNRQYTDANNSMSIGVNQEHDGHVRTM